MSWNQTPGFRTDGYVNLLNKYGTTQDNSTHYRYSHDGIVPDMELTSHYETNGLFAKIIDAPAEESVKHGFDLGLKNSDAQEYIDDMLDMLAWESSASTGIKWARLYGGAVGVLFVNDGGGLDDPLDWRHIRDIDEIRIYERSIVTPDYSSLYGFNQRNPGMGMSHTYGMPEYFQIDSLYGQFLVHESRCLIFKNGILPERTMNPHYRFWGIPEYARIKRELREAVTTHSLGVKLLERSVQAIYSMKGLSSTLLTEDGTNEVVKRLQIIDMARSILNSIAIDSDGESYDFKSATMTGVKEIIDSTCNMLSSVTNIPQTVLFGRSPAGMNSTGQSDLESWYNYVERHQKLMLRGNLRKLLDIIVRVGVRNGKLTDEPLIKLKFNPLWSMSESEQAAVDQTKATIRKVNAETAQLYVDMSALDATEIRKGLAREEAFMVEDLITEDDLTEEDMWGGEGGVPLVPGQPEAEQAQDAQEINGVGVIVLKDGKVLTGRRTDNWMICGPGGHIEPGETPARAAIRETQEEFGITPLNLKMIGRITNSGKDSVYGNPYIFVCTEFDGDPVCDTNEIKSPEWRRVEDLESNLFPPFSMSLSMLKEPEVTENADNHPDSPVKNKSNILTLDSQSVMISTDNTDGGPGSGRYPKGSGATGKLSATGANPSIPDMTVNTQKRHEKHLKPGKSYAGMTTQNYVKKSSELARAPVGGEIMGYKGSDGCIVRYDKSTNDWVKAYSTGVSTMFKPKIGERYYTENMIEDGGTQDD